MNYHFEAVYVTNMTLTLYFLYCENLNAFYRIWHYKTVCIVPKEKTCVGRVSVAADMKK
jgi:hypothetical protein